VPTLAALFAQPVLLLAAPVALALLYLLERWRRRPLVVVVADLALFEPTPGCEAEARARRRRVGLRWLLRALAAVLLATGAAGARLPGSDGGPVLVHLVLDRGVSAGLATPDGGTLLDVRRQHLLAVLDHLQPDDRVRVHLLPRSDRRRAGGVTDDPGVGAVSPDLARRVLAATRATGAHADLDVARHLAGAGGPPLFLATGQAWTPRTAVAVARSHEPGPNRGVLGLARDADGTLTACLESYGAPGSVEVTLVARGAEAEVRLAREVALPAWGRVWVRWTPAELPAPLEAAQVDLGGEDALAADDRACAVLPLRPRRRVGLVGDPGDALRRGLLAVPGTVVEDLAGLPGPGGSEFDLLVVSRLPPVDPPTALLVAPKRFPPGPRGDGGPARVTDAEDAQLPHTLAEVGREPFVVSGTTAVLVGSEGRVLLEVEGGAPLLVARGAGSRLRVQVACPLDPRETSWPRLGSFPLFLAEVLEAAAPRSSARLESHPAGQVWDGPAGPRRFLDAGIYLDDEGQPLVGTAAAQPDLTPDTNSLRQPFSAEDLAAIDAARPADTPTPLAPWLALLGALLALASWYEPAARS
jgi:hypothetical protein